jgi:tetratricopeptide (TPR) repeat protein
MKKLLLILLFVPLVSFGQDELKLFIKGKNNFEKENYDKASTYLNNALQLNPSYVDAHFYTGLLNTKLKKYDKAILNYNKVLELDLYNELAYLNRGRINYILKNREAAQSDFKNAIEIDSKFIEAYDNLVLVSQSLKDYETGILAITKLIEFNPNFRNFFRRGLIKYRMGDKVGACKDAKKSKKLNPNSSSVNQLIKNSCN